MAQKPCPIISTLPTAKNISRSGRRIDCDRLRGTYNGRVSHISNANSLTVLGILENVNEALASRQANKFAHKLPLCPREMGSRRPQLSVKQVHTTQSPLLAKPVSIVEKYNEKQWQFWKDTYKTEENYWKLPWKKWRPIRREIGTKS